MGARLALEHAWFLGCGDKPGIRVHWSRPGAGISGSWVFKSLSFFLAEGISHHYALLCTGTEEG